MNRSWDHNCNRCTWPYRNHARYGGCPIEALVKHAKLGNLSSRDMDALRKEVPDLVA